MNSTKRRRLMMRYLMGEVSVRERMEFEEEYMGDREVLAELISLENDLADAHARGSLDQAEARRFQQRYLTTPMRHRKSEFANVLMNYLSPPEVVNRRRRRHKCLAYFQSLHGFLATTVSRQVMVAAALVLVVIAGLGWMLLINRGLRHEVRQLRQEKASYLQASRQSLDLPAKSKSEPETTPMAIQKKEIQPRMIPPTTAFLFLTASLTRGSGKETMLHLAPTVSQIRVTLNVENKQYPAYDVLLKSADGPAFWESKNLISRLDKQGIRTIYFQVPARMLQNGDYVVKLAVGGSSENLGDLGAYTFRVKTP